MNTVYQRSGSVLVNFPKEKIFPLLCPKLEEEWIPGWECEVLYSLSGFNEKGGIFRTTKPYNTGLLWYTNEFSLEKGKVEFVIFAGNKFILEYDIEVEEVTKEQCRITFTQHFKEISEEGAALIISYKQDDFQSKLDVLGGLIEKYLDGNSN
ncbi:MAG: hypothetical protein LWX07_02100 [Bacteroidetes bacterium]|nr:hypothetical protein [Bacteroidota bacterium]